MSISSFPEWPALLAGYNHVNIYGRTNGMMLSAPAPGRAEYRMVIRPEHLSSPGVAHGGVLAGLMDAVLGAAALTAGELVSTVEFKLNFLHPVRRGAGPGYLQPLPGYQAPGRARCHQRPVALG